MSIEAEVIRVPTEAIKPNPWNPNKMPEHIRSALTKNIERAGFNQPILVRPLEDGTYEIVDGEHRWRMAQDAGEVEVPVIVRDMTEADAKLQTIAMNKLRGEMEPADVARLIREADEAGISLAEQATFTGYTEAENEALVKLLNFDWSQFGQTPGDDDQTPTEDDEEWADLRLRVPISICEMFRSELDRLKGIRETEHDHLALEVMVQNSAQTSAREMTGEL